MANSLNKVILMGNITADPEVKMTAQGTSVCSFSLAVNRKFAKQGEQSVDYINICAWRNSAEFVGKYAKKGNSLVVCGSLQTRNYTNSQGQKVYITEVVADEVSFVNSRESSTEAKSEPEQAKPATYVPSAYTSPGMDFSSPHFEELKSDESLPF